MLSCAAKLRALLSHPRARHLLVVCGLVVGLALAAGAALLLAEARRQALADAEDNSRNLALLLSEEIDRGFQAVDLLQRDLIEALAQQGIDSPESFARNLGTLAVNRDLQRRAAGMPQIAALQLVDKDGDVINTSGLRPFLPVNLDRDHFRRVAARPGHDTYIGAPTQDPVSGNSTVVFAHPFATADGRLLGIVSASIRIDTFEQFFARITGRGNVAFALFRLDGVLLARYPKIDPAIRTTLSAMPGFSDLVDAADHGVLRRASALDGGQRLIVPAARVPHFPLIVTASTGVASALAGWRVEVRSMAGAALLVELVLAVTVLLGVRQLRTQEGLAAANATALRAEAALQVASERERSEQESQRRAAQFDVAVSNLLQGLMMFDTAGHVLIVNRRFIELFSLPADTAQLVRTYAEMLELMVACGNVTPDDLAAIRAWREAALETHAQANFTWELSGGRVLLVTHRAMPDGWLTTYEDATERRRADLRMAYMTRHDALTDLPNRIMLREKLEDALAHARRGKTLALLCLDLDQFKAVNDTLGHPVGDALLQAVARRLMERVRETDTVARLGGDEFAVIQAPIDKPTAAADFADRLITMFDEPFEVRGHPIIIGTSIGIAFAPQDGLDADELLKNADLALYRAKFDGRGVYRLFQTVMDAEMQSRRLLELDLRQALRGGQFELFYQPLVDLRAQAVRGFEALLRWHHPERGLIPPGKFIPLAEEIGAIIAIGDWVLRQACSAAAAWPDEQSVSVNLSPVQFKNRDLVATVVAALREAQLAPRRLELEITETVMLQDTDATLATLHELRGIGVRIAMDDFGTGYSSLSYLRRFPFDRIKIDQSFVGEIGKQHDCGAIVRAVIALSHDLGMATTAEGVETRDQLYALAQAGCSDIQGYLFSRPVPLRDIPAMLRTMPHVADLLRQSSLVA